MARGDRGGFGIDDRNRDGINDEIDRQPGNDGTSREFAQRFDRRTEQEYSNLMETQNQLEQRQLIAKAAEQSEEAAEALKEARDKVLFPSVGKFIIPLENTWAAHAELIKDDSTALQFDPERYVYFDKIIAEKFKNKALTDPNHPDYHKFDGLRTNLAVLRNDIIGIHLHDGSFDPGDETHLPYIMAAAVAIGNGLANDTWYKRPFMPSIGVDVANVEGGGAVEMYKYLLRLQDPDALDTPLRNYITKTLHIPTHHMHLPAIEETPFGPAGRAAPPPQKGVPPIIINPVNHVPVPQVDATEQAVHRSQRAVSIARRLRDPQSLDVPTQEKSIDEARTILRYLKNLQFGDKPMEEWLDQGTPAEQAAKSDAVARLIELYGGQLKMAHAKVPSLVNSMVVQSASEAAGAMALAVAGHTLDNLPDEHPRILTLEDSLTNLPDAWQQRQNHSVNRLLEMLETGIEWSTGQNVSDKPAAERLVEMSNRIHRSARQLRSVDSMEPPARIESVELAREILRKLKGLGFSDMPLESLIGTPASVEEKAAIAAQLSEMVEMYRNVLAEAAQANPNIMNDARVVEASDAVGKLSHTVKLMAAKEIPVSMAASQQISADITQDPEEWKRLSGHTVERLTKSMEGGLEKAVQDLQMQQEQAQQQDEELAKHSVENALLGEAAGKRKRKRRRGGSGGKSSPSLTKSAKRRNASDLNGDGVADRLQGLNLNEKDLIAIRQLGGNLRNIGDQAMGMTAENTPPPTPPVEVAAHATVAPDGQNFVDQQKTRTQQNRNNRRPGSRNNQTQI